MILVADSGSTKADWMLAVPGKSHEKYSTAGFNPYFHDEKFILDEMYANDDLRRISDQVTQVYFYGAGCSSKDRNEVIRLALNKFFKGAKVVVDHDIWASVIATCGDNPGIACILGTGSNSCYFDGEKLHKNNYGLGFIMGDEGSGSYYGKKLITHYLYNILPANLRKAFEEKYKMDKEIMIANVYNSSSANVWLASFAKFFTDNATDPWVTEMVRKGMADFFDLYVCHYENYKNLEVHFVGSIAHYFADILRQVAAEKEVKVGKIIRHPINSLAEYYMTKARNF